MEALSNIVTKQLICNFGWVMELTIDTDNIFDVLHLNSVHYKRKIIS